MEACHTLPPSQRVRSKRLQHTGNVSLSMDHCVEFHGWAAGLVKDLRRRGMWRRCSCFHPHRPASVVFTLYIYRIFFPRSGRLSNFLSQHLWERFPFYHLLCIHESSELTNVSYHDMFWIIFYLLSFSVCVGTWLLCVLCHSLFPRHITRHH